MNRTLPYLPENPILNRITRGLIASTLDVTMLGALVTQADADDLDNKRNQLDSQLEAQRSMAERVFKELTGVMSVLKATKTELATAETALFEAETKLTAAKRLDIQRTPELTAAGTKAKRVKVNITAIKATYDSVGAHTSEEVTMITQQGDRLAELSVLFSNAGVDDASQRAQLADILSSSNALELDELTSHKLQLDATKEEVDEVEAAAVEAHKTTTEQLKSSKQVEETTRTRRAGVVEKIAQRDATKVKADSQLTIGKGHQSELESEPSEIDRRTREHITQQRRAEGERQTRKRSSQQSGPSSPSSSSGSGSLFGSGKSSSFSGGFICPTDGTVSFPYGMRAHPILGYSELHNGTDFAAGCGTLIHITRGGVVSERYFNAGYGDCLMIDHGSKGDTYMTTGYNHATSYVVSVGNHVSQGQIIGYVGATDYLTGYHLYLIVWENGSVTNPMSRWFS